MGEQAVLWLQVQCNPTQQHKHSSLSYQGKTEGSKQHSIYSGKEMRHRLVMPAGARGKVGSLEAMHYNLGELGGILA